MLVRSSVLVAADKLVSGVLIVLPVLLPFTELGVPVEPDVVASDLLLADCFAAFSARRFCFAADAGGMVVGREEVRARVALRALHVHRSGHKFHERHTCLSRHIKLI